ncbi:MAG: hypothetical protein IJ770_03320 [Alphaproteobacteria bacterium]|nr:hypothetical protein [Alphaproteobacteria bacterium]
MANILWTLLYFFLVVDVAFIVVAGIVFTYFLFASRFMRSSPPVPTVGKVKQGMLNAVEEYIKGKPHANVVDLGSGWGSLLLPLAAKYPQHTFIGYERVRLPYIISRFRARKLPNVHIYRQDFFTADFSDVDAIMCFQLAAIMQKLLSYLRQHISKTVRIYVNRYPFKDLIPLEKISIEGDYAVYYVYDIKPDKSVHQHEAILKSGEWS